MTHVAHTPQISFVIVNYKSAQFLHACIASIRKNVIVPHEIIIVNNDATKLDRVEHQLDQEVTTIIEHGVNNGFGYACNLGVRRAHSPIIGFLNPDTQCITKNITEIAEHLKKNKGIVGARLLTPQHKTQPWSVGCEVTLGEIVRSNLGVACSKKMWSDTGTDKGMRDVAWVSGAALFIDRETFNEVGGFDEKFFLYYEDVDLCRRVRAAGAHVQYMPQVRIMHHSGGSVASSVQQKKSYYASQDYYFTKHFGSQKQKILAALRLIFHPHTMRGQ